MASAPTTGRQTWPPWVCPARTASYPSRGELVEHPQVRRVGDAEPHVGAGVGRAGDRGEVVVVQVRVVDAGEGERQVAHLDVEPSAVGEVEPSRAAVKPSRRSRHGSFGVWVLRVPSSGSR